MQTCMVCYNPLNLISASLSSASPFQLISSTGQLTKATLKLNRTSNINTDNRQPTYCIHNGTIPTIQLYIHSKT